MDTKTAYSLQELSDETGVEPRTIRSYVERGLLPNAETRGRNASYAREHLNRLKVIGLLRDARRQITLDEIRLLLMQLNPQQIDDLASGVLKIGGLVDTNDVTPSPSALDYLRSIDQTTGDKPLGKGIPSPAGRPVTSDPRGTSIEQILHGLILLTGGASVSRSVRGVPWIRIPITPDIELSVRGTFTAEQIAQLHRIGDHLNHLIMKGASL